MSLCLKYDPIGRRVDFSERQRALRAKKRTRQVCREMDERVQSGWY